MTAHHGCFLRLVNLRDQLLVKIHYVVAAGSRRIGELAVRTGEACILISTV